MSAPPFGPAFVALAEVLALPVTVLVAIRVHAWWRQHHPRRTDTEERP